MINCKFLYINNNSIHSFDFYLKKKKDKFKGNIKKYKDAIFV